jgi:hypothetical protein
MDTDRAATANYRQRANLAADGDERVAQCLEAVYRELPADVSLDRVSEALEAREHVRTPTSWEMAVTDMIHWLRRLRGRLLTC